MGKDLSDFRKPRASRQQQKRKPFDFLFERVELLLDQGHLAGDIDGLGDFGDDQ